MAREFFETEFLSDPPIETNTVGIALERDRTVEVCHRIARMMIAAASSLLFETVNDSNADTLLRENTVPPTILLKKARRILKAASNCGDSLSVEGERLAQHVVFCLGTYPSLKNINRCGLHSDWPAVLDETLAALEQDLRERREFWQSHPTVAEEQVNRVQKLLTKISEVSPEQQRLLGRLLNRTYFGVGGLSVALLGRDYQNQSSAWEAEIKYFTKLRKEPLKEQDSVDAKPAIGQAEVDASRYWVLAGVALGSLVALATAIAITRHRAGS